MIRALTDATGGGLFKEKKTIKTIIWATLYIYIFYFYYYFIKKNIVTLKYSINYSHFSLFKLL